MKQLEEYRCLCGKLLCKSFLVHGIIEIKCKHCHEIIRFSAPKNDYKKHFAATDLTPQH